MHRFSNVATLAGSLLILVASIARVSVSGGQDADPPEGVLSGRITDDTGAPVTDAEIQLLPAGLRGKLPEAKTDDDGRYRFERIAEPGEYQVQIKSKRWIGLTEFRKLPRVNLSNSSQLVRNYSFERAAQLRIQVVNEEGLGVKDARLYTNLLSEESYRGSESFSTDKTGWATLDSLKPSAGTRIVAVSSDAYGFAHILLVLNEPELSEHKITVEKGEPVVGKAICKDGKPAAGWHVNAMPTWWHFGSSPMGVVIGADGSFTLPHVVGGKYNVSVSIPTSQSMLMVKELKNDIVLPTADGKLALVVDYPSPGTVAAISGRIRLEGAKLTGGVNAWAYAQGGDQSAHYRCYLQPGETEFKFDRLPPGVYRVTFESTEFESVVLPKVKAPTKDLDVTIKVRGMLQLSGTVVRADDQKPVGEFRVLVTKLRTLSSGPNYVQEKTWHEFQNDEGRFAVDVVGPGVYVAAVEAKGLGTRQSNEIKIDGSSNSPVRIELSGGTGLAGIVVDEGGRPVDGAFVVPVTGPSWAGRIIPARSSDVGAVETVRGKFTVSPLTSGQESLRISHPDFAPAIVAATSPDGANVQPLKIVLKDGATLRGQVFDDRGQPLAGVTLHIQDGGSAGGNDEEAHRLATVVTDANGSYEARHLPAVLLQVTRSDKWEAQGVVEQSILIEDGKRQTLDFGGPTRLTGRLVVNAKPLAGASIVLSSDHYFRSAFRAIGSTDDDGVFAVYGIPAGEKTLYYADSQRGPYVRAATFKLARDTGPLGTINAILGKLTVRCRPAAAVESDDFHLNLSEYDPIWISRNPTGRLLPRRGLQDPFVFDSVPVGKHVLASYWPKHVGAQKIVEITPEDLNPTIDLTLPEGTASLEGKFAESIYKPYRYRSFKLWSADESLLGVIFPDESGSYRLENLPAGEYLLKENDTRDAKTLLKISLADGEAKTLDITPALVDKAAPIGFATLRTYTSAGLPLVGCEVRFENATGAPRLHSSQDGRMGFIGQPGVYTASIEYPGFKPLPATLELKEVGTSGRLPDNFEVTFRLEVVE